MVSRITLLMGMSLVLCVSAIADETLSNFFSSQMDLAQQLVCESQAESSADFEFNRFFLNLSAPVSVGVEGVSDLTIAPEIEFVWEKVD